MKLKARTGIIFCNWEKSNDGNPQNSNSEQKEQTNKEKYVFYCSVS